jgi:hypothetical protein
MVCSVAQSPSVQSNIKSTLYRSHYLLFNRSRRAGLLDTSSLLSEFVRMLHYFARDQHKEIYQH